MADSAGQTELMNCNSQIKSRAPNKVRSECKISTTTRVIASSSLAVKNGYFGCYIVVSQVH